MLELAQRQDVGAVGAKLMFPNNLIQHCGVIVRPCGAAHPYYRCQDQHGYFGLINIIRNVSAVTAACMLTRKSVFEEVGGFDENEFVIAFNDVDYCLKLRKKGYLVVYTPYAKLIHYESLTRGSDDVKQTRFQEELNNLSDKWTSHIKSDSYFNINLTIDPNNMLIKLNNE
jgi:GT2 family glycosyltransferase